MAIEKEGLEYKVDEGGGAFYGPKIDLKVKDTMGREWQLSTIQFDFNLPERFDMTFVDTDGKEKRPFMVHRALLGSLERFFSVMVENYGGAYPVWLCPVQLQVIPVGHNFDDYAERCLEETACRRFPGREGSGRRPYERQDPGSSESEDPLHGRSGRQGAGRGQGQHPRTRTGEQMNGLSLEEAIALVREKIDTKAMP